jgi:hypothetical protein
VLDKDPLGTMVVNLCISDSSVARLNKSTLTFTSANWSKPQRVILRGVDNHVINGDQIVSVTVGGQSFNATIRDDDAEPILVGDYNHNGVVDGADYAVWRDTLGSDVAAYSGADGSGNSLVDSFDFDAWKIHFGSALPAAGSGSAAVAIEEGAEPTASADARVAPLSSGNVESELIVDAVPKQLSEKSWAGGPLGVAGSAAANSRDSALLIWLASRAGQDRGAAEVWSSTLSDGGVKRDADTADGGLESVDCAFDALGKLDQVAV